MFGLLLVDASQRERSLPLDPARGVCRTRNSSAMLPSLPSTGCYDALSAKVLAEAGHKAAFVSGYAVSRWCCVLAEA